MLLLAPLSPAWPQRCSICDLVGKIDPASMAGTIRGLSGEDSIYIDGSMEKILTRYTYSPQKAIVTGYLISLAEGYGYSPLVQYFPLTVTRPELNGIAFSAGSDSVWTGDLEGKLFLSVAADGWDSFEKIAEIDGRVNELVRDQGGRLWAACKVIGSGFGKILYSEDGGLSWKVPGGSIQGAYSLKTIIFWDGQFGFAAGDYGTFLNTADGGETWWPAGGPEEFSYRSINGGAATGPIHFWAVTEGGYLYESMDFGNHWSERKLEAVRLSDIDFNGADRGVIVGIRAVFYTSDAGVSWNRVEVEDDFSSVRMIDSLNVVAAGGSGDIWYSSDGGASWSSIGTDCTGVTSVSSMDIDSSGRIWAAGRNEVLSVSPGWETVPDCTVYEMSDTIWGQNLIFRKDGVRDPARRTLLCAHYDAINRRTDPMDCAPGADDNASGVAIVLDIARVLSDAWLENTVEFALFDGEELGLKGSYYFALHADTGAVYDAVINIDMVGNDYLGKGTIHLGAIDGTVDTQMVEILMESSEAFALHYDLEWAYKGAVQPNSDNLSFKGIFDIPSVGIIEAGYRDNPHYHNCTDLFEFIDMDYVTDVARIVLGGAAYMAGYSLAPSDAVVLYQNYPNPFFSATRINFEIPGEMRVEVDVYDVTGRHVKEIEDRIYQAGRWFVTWDGSSDRGHEIASGVYFILMKAGSAVHVKKAVIMH